MPDPTAPSKSKAAAKCPGWHHPYDQANPGGQCDADRKTHAWASRRRETTIGELEKHRQASHDFLGLLGDKVDPDSE